MFQEKSVEQIKMMLPQYVESITTKSRASHMYVCPLCHSGEGPHGTGAFSVEESGTKWKCFSCCESGDVLDLIGKYEMLPSYKEQLQRASELFGIPTDQNNIIEDNKIENNKEKNNMSVNVQNNADFTDFFTEAYNHISETDYPHIRGLSDDTINRFNIDYISEWTHPDHPDAQKTPRLIIPTSSNSYLARDVRAEIPESQQKYSKMKVGKVSLFNTESIKNATKPVVVVEGEIDALSIIEVGGEAVALGSISNIQKFLELVKTNKPTQPLIIAMDNDEAGNNAGNTLIAGLDALEIPCYAYNIAGKYKDANDALQQDREYLKQAVLNAVQYFDELKLAKKKTYMSTSVADHLQDFIDIISNSTDASFVKTGFPKLDAILDGGLYPGLYTIGAIPSLGKTTLAMEIADTIAKSDQDVLIFSLEMPMTELIAKSISRNTLQISLDDKKYSGMAKTIRDITTRERRNGYSVEDKELITKAIQCYGDYAKNIYIVEGVGDVGVEQIRDRVKEHIDCTGSKPIVIIDYVQILAPLDIRATDKQNTDAAVLELKRISRDYAIPVIGISSLNRQSYKGKIRMEAMKESGALEYGSDVILGLMFKGADDEKFDLTKAKGKNPREIELYILKNRNGATPGNPIEYKYYAAFNYFEEV